MGPQHLCCARLNRLRERYGDGSKPRAMEDPLPSHAPTVEADTMDAVTTLPPNAPASKLQDAPTTNSAGPEVHPTPAQSVALHPQNELDFQRDSKLASNALPADPCMTHLAVPGTPGWLELSAAVALQAGELPYVDMTETEERAIAELRATLLKHRGLSSPPEGFYAQFFTRGRLMTYLRSRDGQLPKATAYACECIDYIMDYNGGYLEMARAFEQSPDHFSAWNPAGFFGHDRRGVPVRYDKGTFDVGALAREHGFDAACSYCCYLDLRLWHELWASSIRTGTYVCSHPTLIH